MRILCYGDSNTWGKRPNSDEQFPETVRWPTVLETLIPSASVIENGLRSRTIHLDDPDPAKPGRNGFSTLPDALVQANPIDWIVIALGTSDCKSIYNKHPEDIAHSLEDYFPVIRERAQTPTGEMPHILIVAPLVMREVLATKDYWRGAEEKTAQLGPLLQRVAEQHGAAFINLADYITPSPIDGVHFDERGHRTAAEVIAEVLMQPRPVLHPQSLL